MSKITVEQQIYLALAYRDTSVSAIARAMGIAQQNLCRKIFHNTLKKEDLCRIAKILGGEYVSYFSFPGDVVIGGDSTAKVRGSRIK